jgi:hypothetical protein
MDVGLEFEEPFRGSSSGMQLSFRKRPEVIGGLRGFGGGGEDRPRVILEESDPAVDVTGVPELSFKSKMGTTESGSELDDQLLGGSANSCSKPLLASRRPWQR